MAFYRLGLRIMASDPAPDPATCRTAIGRAYYAALNRADQALDRWAHRAAVARRNTALPCDYSTQRTTRT